ncbi:MAG TPA: DMT family transporter [Fimbriimonas sp.]|nr:DMT family transporter [Fimbriimonas sp.]
MKNSRQLVAVILLLNLLWAPVNLVVSTATAGGFSPLAIGLLRWTFLSCLLIGLLQTAWFKKLTNYKSMPVGEWLKALGLGLVFFGPAHLMFYSAMSMTSEVEGTVLQTTAPLWTAVIGFFVLKEDVPLRRWIAIGLSMIGAYIVTVGFRLPALMDHTAGNLVYGLAVLMESLMGVFAASLTRRNSGIGTLTGQMCGGAIAFILCSLLFKSQFPFVVPSFNLVSYWPLLYLIFLAGLFTFVTWYRIVETVPLTLMVLSCAIQPPVAALLVWVVRGTVPTSDTVIGAIIIMIALLIGYLGGKREAVLNVDPPGPGG